MHFWLQLSRPRFWFYVLGPYMVGIASAANSALFYERQWFIIGLFALYFTFPANVMLYGVNDVFDYETDKQNPKKQAYESWLDPKRHKAVILVSFFLFLPFLALAFLESFILGLIFSAFLFFSVFYSAPPIRFKARPFLDAFSNVLYIVPGIFGFYLITNTFPSVLLILAAWLWTAAMHAYSAIPDIDADKKAGIATIATFLQERKTLFFCFSLYAGAGMLSYYSLGVFGLLLMSVYVLLMTLTFFRKTTPIMHYYRVFPLVNMIVGAMLFFYALLQ